MKTLCTISCVFLLLAICVLSNATAPSEKGPRDTAAEPDKDNKDQDPISTPCGPPLDGCLNGVGYNTSLQFPCGESLYDIDTTGCCENVWFNLATSFCCAGQIVDSLGGSQVCHTFEWDLSLEEQGVSDPTLQKLHDTVQLFRQHQKQQEEGQQQQQEEIKRPDVVLDQSACVSNETTGCINGVPYDRTTQYVCGDGSVVTKGEQGCCMDKVYDLNHFQCCNGNVVKKEAGVETCFVLCVPNTSHSCLDNINYDSLLYQVCGSTIVPFVAHCCNGDIYDPKEHTCCGDSRPSPLSYGTCAVNLGAIDVHDVSNLNEEGWKTLQRVNGPWLSVVSPEEDRDGQSTDASLESEVIDFLNDHSLPSFTLPFSFSGLADGQLSQNEALEDGKLSHTPKEPEAKEEIKQHDQQAEKQRKQDDDKDGEEDEELAQNEIKIETGLSDSKREADLNVPCSKYTAIECVFPIVNEDVRFFCFNRKLYREGMCYVCLDKAIFRGTYACCDGSSYHTSGMSCCDGEIVPEKKACKFFGS